MRDMCYLRTSGADKSILADYIEHSATDPGVQAALPIH